MIFKQTNYSSHGKFNPNLETEGVVALNTDEQGTKDICIWDRHGNPFVLMADQFPSLEKMIVNGVVPEPEQVKGMVDQEFVLDLIKGIRIDSKNIK